jgi:hypothetical protein
MWCVVGLSVPPIRLRSNLDRCHASSLQLIAVLLLTRYDCSVCVQPPYHLHCMRSILQCLITCFRILQSQRSKLSYQHKLQSFALSSAALSSPSPASASGAGAGAEDESEVLLPYLSRCVEHVFARFPIASPSSVVAAPGSAAGVMEAAPALSALTDATSQLVNAINLTLCRLMALFVVAPAPSASASASTSASAAVAASDVAPRKSSKTQSKRLQSLNALRAADSEWLEALLSFLRHSLLQNYTTVSSATSASATASASASTSGSAGSEKKKHNKKKRSASTAPVSAADAGADASANAGASAGASTGAGASEGRPTKRQKTEAAAVSAGAVTLVPKPASRYVPCRAVLCVVCCAQVLCAVCSHSDVSALLPILKGLLPRSVAASASLALSLCLRLRTPCAELDLGCCDVVVFVDCRSSDRQSCSKHFRSQCLSHTSLSVSAVRKFSVAAVCCGVVCVEQILHELSPAVQRQTRVFGADSLSAAAAARPVLAHLPLRPALASVTAAVPQPHRWCVVPLRLLCFCVFMCCAVLCPTLNAVM